MKVLNALRHLRFGQRMICYSLILIIFVLNALRHLRFGQFTDRFQYTCNLNCAQRLAASKVWADSASAAMSALLKRAQRLAASKVWAVFGACSDEEWF